MSDRGDEPTYARVEISRLIENNSSIGDVIALLWFKRELPKYDIAPFFFSHSLCFKCYLCVLLMFVLFLLSSSFYIDDCDVIVFQLFIFF